MRLGAARRLVLLALEARGACLITEECAGPDRFAVLAVTHDGRDVEVFLARQGEEADSAPWLVSNGDGVRWSAADVGDAVIQAVGEALGDPTPEPADMHGWPPEWPPERMA